MDFRSFDEALSIAENSLDILAKEQKGTRTALVRKIDLNATQIIKEPMQTRSADEELYPLMYIFNFEDSLGFAVISANKNTEGLIAVAESGYYNPAEVQENKAFADYMNRAEEYIKSRIITDSIHIIPAPTIDTFYIPRLDIPARVPVKWGQGYLYGALCPNHTAGCGPIAVAQALSYFGNIDTLSLTYDGHDMLIQPLDWTDLRKHRLYYLQNGVESALYCSASDSAHNAISRLCRQLGENMSSTYDSDGSTGTNVIYLRQYLNQIGFTCTSYNSYQSGCTISPLEKGHILLFYGYTNTNVGHYWLVDGLYWYTEDIYNPWLIEDQHQYTDYIYNHINWGWNGRCNGYFLDSVFDIGNYYFLDSNPYNAFSGYNFTQRLNYLDLYL